MKKLFLVDGSNHAFRVHFALPPMHDSQGFPTRCLYGFTTLLAKLMRTHQPDYVVVSFDKGGSFRNELYSEYKGHRPDMPEDLQLQWPHLPGLVEAFGYKVLFCPGFEADDVLGSLAAQFSGEDVEAWIVTGDRDFFQLVGPHVKVLDAMKDEEIDAAGVVERLGLGPERVIDVKALAGDSSDNIPGVPGIGEKTAVKYLQKYGTWQGVLDNTKDIGGKKGQTIADNADNVRLSAKLATIVTDVQLGVTLDDLAPRPMDEDLLREMFDRWDFGKVARKLLPERQAVPTEKWRTIMDPGQLDAMLSAVHAAGRVAVVVEGHGETIPGVALAWSREDAAYVALDGRAPLGGDARAKILALLADPKVHKVAHDAKVLVTRCVEAKIALQGVSDDPMLLDYIAAAHERTHNLAELAQRHLGHTLIGGTAPGQLPFARSLAEDGKGACEQAAVAMLVTMRLDGRLDEGSKRVYHDIEMPLVGVLAMMERNGIRVALDRLDGIRADLDGRLIELERKCHESNGAVFNVNSRHEIAAALFESGKFTPTKKVSDGWSTDSSVLEKLAEGGNLPALILEYRQLQKLKGTYVDKLPVYVKADGRIHTTFDQAVAATGRLSSRDPNLQNIPIRSFEGRRIRDCFVPDPGHVFLSADYSQIELRILAHLTGEETLVESFRRGEDIHRRTASEVFGTPMEQVTFEQRNAAKAVNFGLMYGMSSFRLSNDLQITRDEANKYMEDYFARLPKVSAWIEATRQNARKIGFVETMFGRRRVLTTMHSASYSERMAAEREAVNTRVQGAAADIIKLAMLKVATTLAEGGFATRLLLQVHDELLLEVPEGELAAVRPRIEAAMGSAADLIVPLAVNSATGMTWNEAHG